MGSYANQITFINPFNNEMVGIDRCLAGEILTLWHKGIETTGCCCGHNIVEGVIHVSEKHHSEMLELGYSHVTNEFGVKCYIPKSI